jgi:TIR domain
MKVFISHSAQDRELAQKLAGALKEAGLDVFDMYSDIYPGENWAGKASAALEESDAMLVLVTPHSVHSPTVSYEVGYALGHKEFKGRVFPVRVAGQDDVLMEEIPWILNQFRVFELRDSDPDKESMGEITRALATAA